MLYALITFLAWGTADLFYKKGSVENEKYSHLKTTIMVGLVMGAVAVGTIIVKGIDYNPINLIIYLPVSAMYILSMALGYFGLRYLELSVSSPIQNASGAVSCIIMVLVLGELPEIIDSIAIVLITFAVVMLGVFERQKEAAYIAENEKKYKIGFWAFLMPIGYCIIDSLGTALDGIYLDDYYETWLVDATAGNFEDVANISYMLTFLIVALCLMVYVYVIKKEKFTLRGQENRVAAAGFETVGQLTYVYAMSDNALVAAPLIASYCVCSVLLARVFLKEKLVVKQYIMIILVFIGILLMGISEGSSTTAKLSQPEENIAAVQLVSIDGEEHTVIADVDVNTETAEKLIYKLLNVEYSYLWGGEYSDEPDNIGFKIVYKNGNHDLITRRLDGYECDAQALDELIENYVKVE